MAELLLRVVHSELLIQKMWSIVALWTDFVLLETILHALRQCPSWGLNLAILLVSPHLGAMITAIVASMCHLRARLGACH